MEPYLASLPLLLLVSSRVAGVTAASPVFANRFLAPQLRVAFTFLLALVILPVAARGPEVPDGAAFLIACLLELVVGLLIGFLGQLLFAVLQMAGAMLEMDMGLSMAQTMDPVSTHMEPVLGSLFQTLALVLYFALDAHYWLIRALAESYTAIPAGQLSAVAEGFLGVLSLFGVMLSAAVKMVLPFMAAMLVATAVLAGLNRAVQQMQVFQLGIGIKTVAGFALLAAMIPYFLGYLEPLFADGHRHLAQILQLFSQSGGG
jgi:flagellar biosynthesis protein FliR